MAGRASLSRYRPNGRSVFRKPAPTVLYEGALPREEASAITGVGALVAPADAVHDNVRRALRRNLRIAM